MRESQRACAEMTLAVPSGESSSTKIASQASPRRASVSWAITRGILSRSLYVGSTTARSSAGDSGSEAGRLAVELSTSSTDEADDINSFLLPERSENEKGRPDRKSNV